MAIDGPLMTRTYARARRGLPGLGLPDADGAKTAPLTLLVSRYTALAGGSGFVMGLPGAWLTPLTMPVDLYAQWLLQMHLVQTLASRAGLDIDALSVRERVIACVEDSSASTDAGELEAATGLRQIAQKAMEKLTRVAIERSVRMVVGRVNRRILGGLPIVGGLIGMGSNALAVLQLAQRAARQFQDDETATRLREIIAVDRTSQMAEPAPKSRKARPKKNASAKNADTTTPPPKKRSPRKRD